jgi:membrane-associated phospholipid phosphatase
MGKAVWRSSFTGPALVFAVSSMPLKVEPPQEIRLGALASRYLLSGIQMLCVTKGWRDIVRRTSVAIAVFTVALCAQTAAASDARSSDFGRPGHGRQASQPVTLGLHYFQGYVPDAKGVVTQGLSWPSTDWFTFSLLIGATLAVADDDQGIQAALQARRDRRTDMIARIGRPFGDGRCVLPALGLFYCLGRLSGRDRACETALLGMESVVVSGAVTGAAKLLLHKHRPSSGGSGDIRWGGPALSPGDLSFPSGHSTCAFAVATVVASEYRDTPMIPLLAYSAAALCAFSRLNDNAHYFSDVIVGSAIGHFTARTILARHGGDVPGRLTIAPEVSSRGIGMSLLCRF